MRGKRFGWLGLRALFYARSSKRTPTPLVARSGASNTHQALGKERIRAFGGFGCGRATSAHHPRGGSARAKREKRAKGERRSPHAREGVGTLSRPTPPPLARPRPLTPTVA